MDGSHTLAPLKPPQPRLSSLRHSGTQGTRPSGSSANSSSPGAPTTVHHSLGSVSRKSFTRLANYDKQEQEAALEAANEAKQRARLKQNSLPAHVRCARYIVENKAFMTLTTVLTLYALTGDDIRLMATEKPADDVFNTVTFVCLAVFCIEIILSCVGKPDYFMGFFFMLDSAATVTLILDVTYVNDAIFHGSDGGVASMENSRTARIGARAARIVRVIRLVRILKLYKAVYDARQRANKKRQQEQNPDDWDPDEQQDIDGEHANLALESNLAKKLSDLTTRRCVILILGMMLGHPLLQVTEDNNFPEGEAYAASLINDAFAEMQTNSSRRWLYEENFLTYVYYHNWFQAQLGDSACPSSFCPNMYDTHLFYVGIISGDGASLQENAARARISPQGLERFEDEQKNLDVGSFTYSYGEIPAEVRQQLIAPWTQGGCNVRELEGEDRVGISLLDHSPEWLEYYDRPYTVKCPEDLRMAEVQRYSPVLVTSSTFYQWRFVFYFDQRLVTKEEALTNFLTTAFICIVLCAASIMFARDSQELVLKPIETMMVKVNMIRVNPLIAAKLTDEAFKQEEIRKALNARYKQAAWRVKLRKVSTFLLCAPNEKQKVPNETAILEKTIMKLGTLLALGFGEAGMSIISHNMQGTDSAGVDAMVAGRTVNCIIGSVRMGEFSTFTEVLQGRVMTFVNQVAEILHGLVDSYHGAPSRNNGDTFLAVWTLDGFDNVLVTKMADMATLAFALVLAAVHRSPVLAHYREHPGLQQRLGRKLRVTTTFGLHLGWAIEGALGSEYKIDATYVSPNVNITETIEQATTIYGTNILLSEDLHNWLSVSTASVCRLIDRVRITGSTYPMRLYSVDLDCYSLAVEQPRENIRWNIRQRFRARQFLELEKQANLRDADHTAGVWENSPDIQAMLNPYTIAFREIFGMGYQNYAQGEWKTAQRLLSRTLTQLGFEDGPSAALLRFMQSYPNLEAGKNWEGVHELMAMPPRHGHNRLSTVVHG